MDARQAWQATQGQLQMDMPKASFDTWVKEANLLSHQENMFTIGVPNSYVRDWLETRLVTTVSRLLSGMMGSSQKVEFVVKQWQEENRELKEAHTEETIEEQDDVSQTCYINGKYTFENFVVGSSNRLAHAACLAVSESPARAYNPLFLYGGVGLGKTHLLHAIGSNVRKTDSNLKVLYVSSEEFTNDFISSVREHQPMAFRERYRNIDVLMIDDIQFLVNKEQTQVEFFHTFNTLHGQDKQIIITSDRPPKALVALEERLRSRFEWGLIVDIQPPDLETRIAILRSKAERAGRAVPQDILEVIARQIQSNIRELEGALTRVVAYSDLIGKELTVPLVNTALADLLPQRNSVEPDQVVNVVADTFGVTVDRLKGRDRSRAVSLPRQIAMYILREDVNISLPQIGETLGGRDHTTVIHACSKVSDMIESDDRFRRQIIQIRNQLYGSAAVI